MKLIKVITLNSLDKNNNPAIYELSEEDNILAGLSKNQKYLTCRYIDMINLEMYSDYNHIINFISEIKDSNDKFIYNNYEGVHETMKECEYFIMMHYYKSKLNHIKSDINTIIVNSHRLFE